MIRAYRNKFYMFLIGAIALPILSAAVLGEDAIGLSIFLMQLMVLLAFIYSAKSKGYSGWIGFLLSFLSLLGLVILAFLPDKTGAASDMTSHL